MSYHFPRCRVLPLPERQVSLQIDGVERLRWHYGSQYLRPFYYPLTGPTGSSLTRMGHPGAPNHEHHRSIWFAHYKVLGINFWNDETEAVIRQKEWLSYEDGDDEAVMAVRLGWYDGHDPRELLEQEVVTAVRPGSEGETFVEIQSIFRPIAESLEFQKTNFGFMGIRVAKDIAEHFGGGQLTNSEGQIHEPAIFGKPARWMDYSGPIQQSDSARDSDGDHVEGITWFDHATNPGHPTSWHVREDGWMGVSPCMHEPLTITRAEPLRLRYLLHAHAGPIDADRANEIAKRFDSTPPYEIVRSEVKHTMYAVRRGEA